MMNVVYDELPLEEHEKQVRLAATCSTCVYKSIIEVESIWHDNGIEEPQPNEVYCDCFDCSITIESDLLEFPTNYYCHKWITQKEMDDWRQEYEQMLGGKR